MVWLPLVIVTQRHIQAFDKSQASLLLHTHKPKKKKKKKAEKGRLCFVKVEAWDLARKKNPKPHFFELTRGSEVGSSPSPSLPPHQVSGRFQPPPSLGSPPPLQPHGGGVYKEEEGLFIYTHTYIYPIPYICVYTL